MPVGDNENPRIDDVSTDPILVWHCELFDCSLILITCRCKLHDLPTF